MAFLRDVRHSGDEAAAVGPFSEAVRFEHEHQTWQTTKYATFVMHKAAAAVANATYGGVRAALASEARRSAIGHRVEDYTQSLVEPPRRVMHRSVRADTPDSHGDSDSSHSGRAGTRAGGTEGAGAQGTVASRQDESKEEAKESEEQQNCRWAMAKEFGEASGDNGTSTTTPNRSDVSNTNGIANATAPRNGVSAGAGDTTVAVHANGIRSTAPAGTLGLATGT